MDNNNPQLSTDKNPLEQAITEELKTEAIPAEKANSVATPGVSLEEAQKRALKPKSNKKLIIIIAIILVLLGGLALAYKFFIYDQKPENFVRASLLNTIKHNKQPAVTMSIKPSAPQLTAFINSIEFTGKPSSNNQLFSGQLTLDSPMLGKNSIDVILDLNKKSIFIKPSLSSTLNLLLPEILGSQMGLSTENMTAEQKRLATSFMTNAINSIITLINNNWIQLPQEDTQQLFSNSENAPDFTKIQKECSANSSREKLVTLISVKSELNKIESSRVFEIGLDQDKLKDFAKNDKCGQLVFDKDDLDSQLKSFEKLPTMKLQISPKKQIEAVVISNKDLEVSVKTDFNTSNIADVELPKDSITVQELQNQIQSKLLPTNIR